MPQMANREYRDFNISDLQLRSDENEQYIVEGYAMKWAPYKLYEDDGQPIYEEFKRSCFEGTDLSDVIFQENHQGQVLARLRNMTLEINFDDIGMHIRANLGLSQKSRDAYEAIKNGLMDRMSWGFIPGEYYFDKVSRTFIHTKIKKVFDVSVVSMPANDNTNISSVRQYIDGEIEKLAQELREHEELKEKLQREFMKGEIKSCLELKK